MQEDQKIRLLDLLERYAKQQLSEAEAAEMLDILQTQESEAILEEKIMADVNTKEPEIELGASNWNRIWENIQYGKKISKILPIGKKRQWLSAAAILLLIAAGSIYFIIQHINEKPQIVSAKNDVHAPAINKATLTLANGKQIILDSVGKGSLAGQGAVSASKTGDGQLVYNNAAPIVEFHTLTNPRGSRPVQLQLPDGSIAWLNAASSITFPTAFPGAERSVNMTGEAYFEVKHNAKQPFRVKVGDQTIEDLGTSFNVNSYIDEGTITTTLLEGVIRIKDQTLKPGEQYKDGKVRAVDTEPSVAWKNGLFMFEDADINTTMRQIARWYDVDIVYDGALPEKSINGQIPRNVNVSEVIKMVELTGNVHFEISGRKIIVRK